MSELERAYAMSAAFDEMIAAAGDLTTDSFDRAAAKFEALKTPVVNGAGSKEPAPPATHDGGTTPYGL